MFVMS